MQYRLIRTGAGQLFETTIAHANATKGNNIQITKSTDNRGCERPPVRITRNSETTVPATTAIRATVRNQSIIPPSELSLLTLVLTSSGSYVFADNSCHLQLSGHENAERIFNVVCKRRTELETETSVETASRSKGIPGTRFETEAPIGPPACFFQDVNHQG